MNTPHDILKTYWGYDDFRYPQDKIIEAVMSGHDVLALMPTGGGKSVCFQVPAMASQGICIVMSPLVALIKDQIDALKRKGIKALSIPSGTAIDDVERILNNAVFGNYKFLYLSPERLQQDIVKEYVKKMNVSLIAIDEAHCISHWGKDFRPSYLGCTWLKEEFPNVPVLALTASATPKVQQDILNIMLIPKAKVIEISLKRPNIGYTVYETEEKFQLLERIFNKNKGSAILYMRSRQGTIQMCEYLKDKQIRAAYFHGGMSSDEKNEKLSMWLMDEVQVMVATNAFGMGIDKPDVRTVIHWEIPPTIEDYFQEAGRAGRDGKKSFAILLYNKEDQRRAEWQLTENLPDVDFLKQLYTKLNAHFFIAFGEGTGIVFPFDFNEFCKKYNLPWRKTFQGLEMLDRLSVLSLGQNFNRKVVFRFLVHNRRVMDYLEGNVSIRKFVLYLLRTYPGLYEYEIAVNIQKLADKLDENVIQLKKWFLKLEEDGIIFFQNKETDTEIEFLRTRDDERVINSVAKSVRVFNESKIHLQQAVFNYITDNQRCKSVQLLEYFGEPQSEPCGICSVCVGKYPESKSESLHTQLLKIINKQPISSQEIMMQLPYAESDVMNQLQQLLESGKIKCNIYNQYTKNE